MRSSSRQRPQPCPIGALPGGVEGADEWIRCERDPGRYDVARRYPAHRMNRADIDLVVLEHETVLAFEGIQQVGQERLIPPMIATMSARRVEDPGVQRRVAPGRDEAAHDGVVAVEADDAADTAGLLPIPRGDSMCRSACDRPRSNTTMVQSRAWRSALSSNWKSDRP